MCLFSHCGSFSQCGSFSYCDTFRHCDRFGHRDTFGHSDTFGCRDTFSHSNTFGHSETFGHDDNGCCGDFKGHCDLKSHSDKGCHLNKGRKIPKNNFQTLRTVRGYSHGQTRRVFFSLQTFFWGQIKIFVCFIAIDASLQNEKRKGNPERNAYKIFSASDCECLTWMNPGSRICLAGGRGCLWLPRRLYSPWDAMLCGGFSY